MGMRLQEKVTFVPSLVSMTRKIIVHPQYLHLKDSIEHALKRFKESDTQPIWAERNTIKVETWEETPYAIKSFRIPHLFNQLMYRFFRKSKARRSYEYSVQLKELGIQTPFPLAYSEETSAILFKDSYYVSELVTCDATYRDLIHNPKYPNRTEILKQFTRFTYKMHEAGVHFLDHSPGNTLIKKLGDVYDFYIVDVNRMEFGALDLPTRIANFSRLTKEKDMIVIMASEYANLMGEDEVKIQGMMLGAVADFQKKFARRRAWKKRIKFWKK